MTDRFEYGRSKTSLVEGQDKHFVIAAGTRLHPTRKPAGRGERCVCVTEAEWVEAMIRRFAPAGVIEHRNDTQPRGFFLTKTLHMTVTPLLNIAIEVME